MQKNTTKKSASVKIISCKLKAGSGFTLMEIVVATTIFAFVATAMMALFNYTLKINRRTEALRQSAQGMRTFVEGLVKQIRNGQIYYGVTNNTVDTTNPSSACLQATLHQPYYADRSNMLRILDTDGADTCFYLADSQGNYVGAGSFGSNGGQLVMEKNVGGSYSKQVLNPTNFFVDNMMVIVRPVCDPYDISCAAPYSSLPKIQPSVSLIIKLRVALSTGEQVTIYYQTSISSNKYDIPSS